MTSLGHGYAIIEDCCSSIDCDEVASQVDTIAGAGTRCLLANRWCQSLACLLRRRLALELPEIEQLVAVQCTFFNKTQTNNWFVAFHQDRSIPVGLLDSTRSWPGMTHKEGMAFIHGPDALLQQMIAIRLHIDDSTLENGPLRVIPGSHDSGTLSPTQIDDFRKDCDDRLLTVSKGGVIAMRPLLLHASSRSHTETNRRVLHFLFGPRSIPEGLAWKTAV